jgi:hypothetical protein
VLFGGATGDTGKYIITGDTYTLDLISFKWTKLEGKQKAIRQSMGISHQKYSKIDSNGNVM